LAAKTGYGRTVSNIQGKGIPNDRSIDLLLNSRIPEEEGAATEKLRDPKPAWTRGTSNKLEPEECRVRDGT